VGADEEAVKGRVQEAGFRVQVLPYTIVIPAKAGILSSVIPATAGILSSVIPAKAGIQ
jgi:hypothetical protein